MGQTLTATGTNESARNTSADPDAFARELTSALSGGSAKEKMAQSMERLAAVFPNMSVSARSMSTFGEVASYSAKTNDSTINISQDILTEMADDEELFTRVRDMLSNLLSAGGEQKMVNSGGQTTHRNVSIEGLEVRYTEVQRGPNGTQLSVSSLTLQTEEVIDSTLDMLFAARDRNAQSSSSRQSSNNTGFQSILNSTNSWRFQSFVSSQSWQRVSGSWNMSSSNLQSNLLEQQMLMSSQRVTANLEIMIEQWQGEGGQVDLWSYMQIAGLSDPLVLDLGDEGINLRGAEDGVYFDIKGDGSPVKTAFIQGNNAFLYLDENGNGVADDVSELFGDYGGYKNGFEKLAQYDDNGDGVIDENDAIYSQLRVWRDLNGDGVNQREESMSLAEAGIQSLNLRHDNNQQLDATGNVIGERSTFTRSDGSKGLMADVWLKSL